jgi:N-carbamoyl-L-amino-acid hydrolase
MRLSVDPNRIQRELDKLATFSDVPSPAVTRVVYTATDLAGRRYIKHLCEDAGLVIREDAAGNLFARWTGWEPDLPAVGTGSHIDAIPNAGMYDGTVGVIGGIEAIRTLQRAGYRPRRGIELLLFTAEEPTRFGIGCMGSRLLARVLDPAKGSGLKDNDGHTLDEAREMAGFSGSLADVPLPAGYYSAFVELHIEQGPLLERGGIDVGVVTNIAAPASLVIRIEGEGGHAGAVLMPDRHDAFCAAAEFALCVEAAAKGTGAIDTVATIGICEVFPGAVNSVPSRVRMTLDVRDTDQARRDSVIAQVSKACEEIGVRRGVRFQREILNTDAPATCDPRIVDALTAACEAQGLSYLRMVSRAYHDSLFMARIVPTAMLFVPCRGGVSHRPDEFSSTAAIANGVRVLASALATLSST